MLAALVADHKLPTPARHLRKMKMNNGAAIAKPKIADNATILASQEK